ncbi:hypothetical protein TWF173_010068 [Orbilia oligospora]|nr:hypothetical protein TWF173_010068 [Orbilia oligospora]
MSSKKLPPFPGIPLPTPSSSTAAAAAGPSSSSSPLSNRANISLPAPTLPFSTYPQPHFHRAWYRKCLHSTPTVRIPYGPEVEYLSATTTTEGGGGGGSVGGRYISTNKNRLCMCDSVDGYFLEEVDQSATGGSSNSLYVEKEVVEEFWRILEWEDEKERKLRKEKEGKVGKVVKGVVKGVKEVVGSVSPGKRRKEKEKEEEKGRKRVLRWVPRWRRLEGCCAGCAGVGEEGEEGGLRWRVV